MAETPARKTRAAVPPRHLTHPEEHRLEQAQRLQQQQAQQQEVADVGLVLAAKTMFTTGDYGQFELRDKRRRRNGFGQKSNARAAVHTVFDSRIDFPCSPISTSQHRKKWELNI